MELYPEGYPRLSAYVNSDNDTALFRRFGVLHARLLLYKEVEITELEAHLNALDKVDAGDPDGEQPNLWRLSNSISLNNGFEHTERKELVEKIDQKLEAYGTSGYLLVALLYSS